MIKENTHIELIHMGYSFIPMYLILLDISNIPISFIAYIIEKWKFTIRRTSTIRNLKYMLDSSNFSKNVRRPRPST